MDDAGTLTSHLSNSEMINGDVSSLNDSSDVAEVDDSISSLSHESDSEDNDDIGKIGVPQ